MNAMAVDYHELRLEEYIETLGDQRLEKHYNKKKDSYVVLLREERLGDILGGSDHLHEGDADQLLEAGKTSVDLEKILGK